jgi:hypothetical protein
MTLHDWLSLGQYVLTAIIGVWINTRVNRVHVLINSRMTELLDSERKSSRAEGVNEGRQATADLAIEKKDADTMAAGVIAQAEKAKEGPT